MKNWGFVAASAVLAPATASTIPHTIRGDSGAIEVNAAVPSNAGIPVLHPFVSFSLEFAFFPDYAGER
jgi:hypothetical protein